MEHNVFAPRNFGKAFIESTPVGWDAPLMKNGNAVRAHRSDQPEMLLEQFEIDKIPDQLFVVLPTTFML